MGREIRQVPAGWEHPRRPCEHAPEAGGCEDARAHGGKCLQPLYDQDYETACAEWKQGFLDWENGGRQAHLVKTGEDCEYWDCHEMPTRQRILPPEVDGRRNDTLRCL